MNSALFRWPSCAKPSPSDVDPSKCSVCKLIEHTCGGIKIIGLTFCASIDDSNIHAPPATNIAIVTSRSDFLSTKNIRIWIGTRLYGVEHVMTDSNYVVRTIGDDSTSSKRRCVIRKIACVWPAVGREREIFRSSYAKCQLPYDNSYCWAVPFPSDSQTNC